METPNEEVISRIRKLFALANNDGATEAEAALALSKANEILLRYNLTADAVAASKGDGRPVKVEEGRVQLGRRESWQHRLVVMLARQNFCYPFYSGSYVVFVGRTANIEATREMFNWISPQVERLAAAGLLQYHREWSGYSWDKVNGRTWKVNFYRGITTRIQQRLSEERKKLEQEQLAPVRDAETGAPQTMALAIRNLSLATLKENEGWVKQHVGKLRARSSHSSNYNRDGYNAGARAGDGVSLRGRPLGSGARGALDGG